MKILVIYISAHLLAMLACHALASSSNDDLPQAHALRLAEARIGPRHRVKRDKDEDDKDGESNEDDQGGQDENDFSDDNDVEGDDTDESEISDNKHADKHSNKKFLDNYLKDNSALKKLMSESSDLAREIGSVFELLTHRESEIMKEMSGLKDALNGAVIKLKNTLSSESNEQGSHAGNRVRRQFNNQKPYKACVSIETLDDIPGTGPGDANIANANNDAGLPSVQEYIPSKNDPVLDQSLYKKQGNSQFPTGPAGEVDLSQVMWVRLNPNQRPLQLHQKVENLLQDNQNSGRDVLVIPVSHNFANTEEVKNGFLQAVRLRPRVMRSPYFRPIRRLRVLEL